MIILTVSSHLHAGEITLSLSRSLSLSLWQIAAYADKEQGQPGIIPLHVFNENNR